MAILQPAHALKQKTTGSINYVADWIMDVLDDLIGRVEDDIVVETSIDPALQLLAEQALSEELAMRGAKARRRSGRRDLDVARWLGARHDRRPRLCGEPVQPRGCRQAPTRIRVQAVRLSHRAGARADARYRPRGPPGVGEGLAAGKLYARISRAGHADPGARHVAQYGGGASHAGIRPDCGDSDRASARHCIEARAQCLDCAWHVGSLGTGNGVGIRNLRQ